MLVRKMNASRYFATADWLASLARMEEVGSRKGGFVLCNIKSLTRAFALKDRPHFVLGLCDGNNEPFAIFISPAETRKMRKPQHAFTSYSAGTGNGYNETVASLAVDEGSVVRGSKIWHCLAWQNVIWHRQRAAQKYIFAYPF